MSNKRARMDEPDVYNSPSELLLHTMLMWYTDRYQEDQQRIVRMADRYKDLSEDNAESHQLVLRMQRELARYQDTVARLIGENERLLAITTRIVPILPPRQRNRFIDEITNTAPFEEVDLTADEELDEN